MSSFRNAFQSKSHRERSQPAARQQLGILEKKKDYVERARNFHGKEKRLKALRWKALNKNPDEFYHKMISSETRNGVHWMSRETNYDQDTIMLLKRQDSNYIRMHNQLQKKKLENLLQNHLHHISIGCGEESESKREHIKFYDDDNDNYDDDTEKELKNDENQQSLLFHDDDNDDNDNDDNDNDNDDTIHNQASKKTISALEIKSLKERKKRLQEYLDRTERIKKLDIVDKEFELHRKLSLKGKRRKVAVDANGIPVYRWRTQRKK